jgi:hypothetical protein
MSELNPYDKFLDGRPLETILAATPNAIAEYFEVLGAKQKRKPAPDKWSAAEIVCHLADCELVFGFRLRQTLAEDNPTIQPFDQDKWAWSSQYFNIPPALGLETFSALRKWNLHLIHDALPAAAGRPTTHPERGAMTFQTIVKTMAGHDLNHLEQLRHLVELPE